MDLGPGVRLQVLQSLLNQLEKNDFEPSQAICTIEDLQLLGGDDISSEAKHSAVDALLQRMVSLIEKQNEAAVGCGLRLLAAAARQVGIARFAQLFPSWGAAVLAVLKRTGQTPASLPAWAALAAIYDRVTELVEVGEVRRDAAGLVGRTVQSAGALLQGSDLAVQPSLAMLGALCSGICAVPHSFRAHLQALERYTATLLMSGVAGVDLCLAASRCLALLPRVSGTADAWSLTAQRLLATAHAQLDIAFMGLEDKEQVDACKRELQPGANPFQAPSVIPGGGNPGLTAKTLALTRVGGLLDCLERLLTEPYPVAVPLPVKGLLGLLFRIVGMDDSIVRSGRVPPSASGYTQLCGRLPSLHASALGLLAQLLRAARPAAAPHMVRVSAALADLLARTAALGFAAPPPFLRQQLYWTAAVAVQMGGWAAVQELAAGAQACAVHDLYGPVNTPASRQGNGDGAAPVSKKRKKNKGKDTSHGLGLPSPVAASGDGGNASADRAGGPADVAAQLAVLNLLETIYKVGGAVLPLTQRASMDATVAQAAATLSAAAARVTHGAVPAATACGVSRLHLAALRALTASAVAPAHHRPPYLPLTLQLLRQGLGSGSPAVASFCTDALLSCEALMHVRAAPPPPSPQPPAPSTPAPSSEDHLMRAPRMWSALEPRPDPLVAKPPDDADPSSATTFLGRGEVGDMAASPSHPPQLSATTLLRDIYRLAGGVVVLPGTATPGVAHDQDLPETAAPSQRDSASDAAILAQTGVIPSQSRPLTSGDAAKEGVSGKRKAPEAPSGGTDGADESSGASLDPGGAAGKPVDDLRPAGPDAPAAGPALSALGGGGDGPSGPVSSGPGVSAGASLGTAGGVPSLWGGEASDDSEDLPEIDSGPSSDEESDDE